MGVAAIAWLILLPAGLFYFLLWRPQKRRMTAAQQLQITLEQNDEVMTTSGIYGRIAWLGDDDIELEIAPGTVIRVARGAIGQRITSDDDQDNDK